MPTVLSGNGDHGTNPVPSISPIPGSLSPQFRFDPDKSNKTRIAASLRTRPHPTCSGHEETNSEKCLISPLNLHYINLHFTNPLVENVS